MCVSVLTLNSYCIWTGGRCKVPAANGCFLTSKIPVLLIHRAWTEDINWEQLQKQLEWAQLRKLQRVIVVGLLTALVAWFTVSSQFITTVLMDECSYALKTDNPYAILRITSPLSASSPKIVKSAFRKVALACHPDKVPQRRLRVATQAFLNMSNAHDLLLKKSTHAVYRECGVAGVKLLTQQLLVTNRTLVNVGLSPTAQHSIYDASRRTGKNRIRPTETPPVRVLLQY